VLCGVTPEMHETIRNYGLADAIGEENIFETRSGVFASAKAALVRARDPCRGHRPSALRIGVFCRARPGGPWNSSLRSIPGTPVPTCRLHSLTFSVA